MVQFSRRVGLGLLVSGLLALSANGAFAADKVKVAGVYIAPIEQQWISRIHKAMKEAEAKGRNRIRLLRKRLAHRQPACAA